MVNYFFMANMRYQRRVYYPLTRLLFYLNPVIKKEAVLKPHSAVTGNSFSDSLQKHPAGISSRIFSLSPTRSFL